MPCHVPGCLSGLFDRIGITGEPQEEGLTHKPEIVLVNLATVFGAEYHSQSYAFSTSAWVASSKPSNS
jgi:hypothetical protein